MASLTDRELEYVEAICNGATDREVAYQLGLKHSSVRTMMSSIYRKCGCVSRYQLICAWMHMYRFSLTPGLLHETTIEIGEALYADHPAKDRVILQNYPKLRPIASRVLRNLGYVVPPAHLKERFERTGEKKP